MLNTARRLLFTAAVVLGACGDSSGSDSTSGDAGVDATGGKGPVVTNVMGRLGALGGAKPTVSAKFIVNSGETLIYLTSAPLTCTELMVSRWLGAFTKDAQVVEVVIHGPATVGTTKDAEVNFAAGGKSSAYETSATKDSVTVTFSKATTDLVEGSFAASYANPASKLKGTFHADFCDKGQGY